MSTLFEDIIVAHVLTRLPVKYLIQLKCVCKSWLYILSNPDPQFVSSNIIHNSQYPEYECLIMSFYKGCGRSVDILSRSRFSYTRIDNTPQHYQILGSINGLVCLNSNYMFFLWNPVTGLGKATVPDRHCMDLFMASELLLYGFGWDHVASEFKVVVCYYRPGKSLQGVVYTSNSDSWTVLASLDVVSLSHLLGNPDIIVGGCPCWSSGSGYNRFVVKFETGSNRFKEFLLPYQILVAHKDYYSLVDVNDCLAVMAYSPSPGTLIDVFQLDEESGVWSKTYTFGPINCYVGKFSQCFKFGSEIVFDSGKMLYDPKTDSIKVIGDRYWRFNSGYSYTPSLMFLQGMEPLHTQSRWRPPKLQECNCLGTCGSCAIQEPISAVKFSNFCKQNLLLTCKFRAATHNPVYSSNLS